jgi:hypothetical protein
MQDFDDNLACLRHHNKKRVDRKSEGSIVVSELIIAFFKCPFDDVSVDETR